MREVYYSFDYDEDGWRVQQIRQMGLFEGNEPALKNKWEEVKGKGDVAIKQWIDDNMKNKTCLIVLIGEKTANSRWVKYEIECAWNKGMGMLGIDIHNILDQNRKKASKGRNPLNQYQDAIYYDPMDYNDIKSHLRELIEKAISNRKTKNAPLR